MNGEAPSQLRVMALHALAYCEGYGDRLQYSVFRCRLTRRELQRLRWELVRVLDQEDAWLIVPLCDACTGKVDQHGELPDRPVHPPQHVVV